MKKTLLLLLIICSFTSSYAQKIIHRNIDSYELNGKRKVKIFLPRSYKTDTLKSYPLAVVLDSEILFDIYVGNAKLFSVRDKAPEQIIIGIFQNQKEDQLEKDCGYEEHNSMPSRSSESFYRFVRGDLLDFMEENYRISPFKTVIGNSLTANFINYFVIEDYPGFDALININPSFAPDIPTYLQARLDIKKKKLKKLLYYYMINGDYNSFGKQEKIEEVNTVLSEVEQGFFKYRYDYVTKSTKTSSIGEAIPRAFSFIFDIYSAISKEEFEEKIADLTPPEAIDFLKQKYSEIDYHFGSDLKIREKDILAIEPIIIDRENGDYLKEFGKMILELYPESPIGNYYIGRYYESGGDVKRAIKNYKIGYSKLRSSDDDYGYYRNIERALEKLNSGALKSESEEPEIEFNGESDEE